ncbi:hypothetical protein NQ317_019842 [Molorchus minor]|uniref:MADF domain-containing protein n=1 Tax=Molorchus minor TaxID=1323400 RepID=A0ABQ9J944_9CUCU|nr:hypothetical protein NQ317_019842 [Molorchus minor]
MDNIKNIIHLNEYIIVGNKLVKKQNLYPDTVEQLNESIGQGENLEAEIQNAEHDSLNIGNTEQDGFVWDHKANMLLLDEYHKIVDQFRNPTVKKKPLWDKIANNMFQYGYDVKGDIIDKKFRNMKNTFNKIKDNKKTKRTGRGVIQWPYYTKFDSIFVNDKTVNINNIISTLDSHLPESTFSTNSDSDRSTTPITPTTSHDSESRLSNGKVNQNRLDKYRKKMVELEEQRVEELKKIRLEVAESNRLTQEKINLFKTYLEKKFPKNNEKRRVWLSLCNLEETSYRNWWRICSKHFREIDFDTSFWPKRVLLSSAVPSIQIAEIDTNTSISSSGHIDPAASTSTSVPVFGECPGVSPGISSTIGVSCSTVPMVIAPTEEVTESTDISKLCPEKGIQTDVVPTTPSQNIRYVGDLEPLHFASPRKAKRHLEFVKEVVQEQKKKIRKLHDHEKALKQHIHSLQNLLDHLMEKNILSEHAAASIKFLLSYKLSQDHLETYFSALRSRGGHNNNPTALQFKTAYKRFLVRHQISASKFANCSILDSTTILFVGAGAKSRTVDSLVDNLESDDIIEHDHDYFSFLLTLSPFIEEIVKYISGFVVRKVKNIIKCRFCLDQLESVQLSSTLLTIKKYGNLTMASEDVNKICLNLEKLIRQYKNVFHNEAMNNHILSQDLLDNHRIQLIKLISAVYLKIRLHHEAKITSDNFHDGSGQSNNDDLSFDFIRTLPMGSAATNEMVNDGVFDHDRDGTLKYVGDMLNGNLGYVFESCYYKSMIIPHYDTYE